MYPKSSANVSKSNFLCHCVWSAFGASAYGWTPCNTTATASGV